jgi:hypothetical protein
MRRIPLTDLIGDAVERTDKDAASGTTLIWFRSHRRLYIIDTQTEHRVEAYAP